MAGAVIEMVVHIHMPVILVSGGGGRRGGWSGSRHLLLGRESRLEISKEVIWRIDHGDGGSGGGGGGGGDVEELIKGGKY